MRRPGEETIVRSDCHRQVLRIAGISTLRRLSVNNMSTGLCLSAFVWPPEIREYTAPVEVRDIAETGFFQELSDLRRVKTAYPRFTG
ncbi:hypothetical protein GGR01_001963 [Acetobacter oeni]|nr:hypothetical protein [Acetobacter oeni]